MARAFEQPRPDLAARRGADLRAAAKAKILKPYAHFDKLVTMTRIIKSTPPATAKPRRRARSRSSGQWLLHDAKARFSELVRRVRSEGPQRVTVHGRDEVIVITAERFRTRERNRAAVLEKLDRKLGSRSRLTLA